MKLTFDRSRIVGFSDAVFSIAMTLLILEVVVPSYQVVHKYGMWDVLADRIPSFIGFVVSFFVSALYWIDYMKITKFATSFSFKALWANIFLLFFVVLLPFSTAFYVNGIHLIGPFVFYSINLSLIAFMMLILLLNIAKDEAGKSGMDKMTRNWLALKLGNTILVWALAAALALISIEVARFIWILIFIIDPIIDRYYERRLKK